MTDDTERQTFRLGDLIAVTTSCDFSGNDGESTFELIDYMGRGTLCRHTAENLHTACAAALKRQYPWLAGIRVPDSIALATPIPWATAWAWLDTQERKHGSTFAVDPLPDAEIPEHPEHPEYSETTGADVREMLEGLFPGATIEVASNVEFNDLPPQLQDILRQLGYRD